MKNFGPILLFALAALAAASCGGTDEAVTVPSRTPPGAMDYTGYDEAGAPVVTGWIRLDIPQIQTSFDILQETNGAWHLEALVDPRTIGPQVGDGVLVAVPVGDDLGVELNPGQADNNVSLLGRLRVGGPAKARYEGTWAWSTIAGPRRKGTFVAVEH